MKSLKKIGFMLVILVCVAVFAKVESDPEKARKALRALDGKTIPKPKYDEAFLPGEYLKFDIDYGFVTAGWATMEVVSIVEYKGRPCYRFETKAGTNPTFSLIYKVDDRALSLMDTEFNRSLRHEKHLSEGSYRASRWFIFDQEKNRVSSSNYNIETYPNALDILSAFYYTRMLELTVGDTFWLPNHTDGKNYPLRVAVHNKERVKVPAGEFDCIVIEPILSAPGIFEHKGNVYIWLTDDERRIPVLMKTKIIIGSIDARLVEYRTK